MNRNNVLKKLNMSELLPFICIFLQEFRFLSWE